MYFIYQIHQTRDLVGLLVFRQHWKIK